MSNTKRNFAYSGLGVIARLAPNLFLVFALARFFTLSQFGTFSYAIALGAFLGMIVDYGYSLKIARDTAIDTRETVDFVALSLIIKLIISVLIIAITFAGWFCGAFKDNGAAVFIYTIGFIIQSYSLSFIIPFRAINKFNIESSFFLFNNGLVFIVSALTAYITHDVICVALSFIFIKLFSLYKAQHLFVSAFGKLRFKHLANKIKPELINTFPFMLHAITASLYLSIDTFILKYYVNNESIALYQAALRLTLTACLCIDIFQTVLLTKLASLWQGRPIDVNLHNLIVRFNWLIMSVGTLVALSILLLDKWIIVILFKTDFLPMLNFLPIFLLIIILRYVGVIYGIILTAANKQSVRAYAAIITALFISIADIFIIPHYGLRGAATILLFAHLLINAVYITSVKQLTNSFFLLRVNTS